MANGNGRGISEDEFLTLLSDQFPQVIGQVEQGVNQVFDRPGLTPEEEDRLSRLDTRAARLQPLEIQGPQGSGRIPGNPYSVDYNPVVRGGQQLFQGIVNKVRENRRLGDPEEAKRAQEKINQAETELKKLQKDSLKDMSMLGPDAPDDLSEAVSGDKKQRMEQLRREIETQTQRLRDSEGITTQRADLLEKKEQAQAADENIRSIVENISPRVAQTIFDRQETRQRQQQQHDLTMGEIEARHEATMDEIAARTGGQAGSGSGIPAQTLKILSDNVGSIQEKINNEIGSLENQKARLNNALGDEQLEETAKSRLPEGTTIQDRIGELDAEIETKRGRLQRSIKNMIDVAAERNNLDREMSARLLGYNPSELGYEMGEGGSGEQGGQGQQGSQSTQGTGPNQQGTQGQQSQNQEQSENKTMSQSDLEEYAEAVYEGDIERARSYLQSQGFTIQEN